MADLFFTGGNGFQKRTTAVKAAEARQNAVQILRARDYSRKYWKAAWAAQNFQYFTEPDSKEAEWPRGWEPTFRRIDKLWRTNHSMQSGAAGNPKALLNVPTRGFAGFNGLPMTVLHEGTRMAITDMKKDWKDTNWTKCSEEFDFVFDGMAIDSFTDPHNSNLNYTVITSGTCSTWNNNLTEYFEAGDLFRFDAPQKNLQFTLDDADRTVPVFALDEFGDFESDRKDMRLAAGVFKVEQWDALTNGYHGRVEHPAGPGEQMYVKICPAGNIRKKK